MTMSSGVIIACVLVYVAVFGLIWGAAIPIAILLFAAGVWLTLQAIGHEIIEENTTKSDHHHRQTTASSADAGAKCMQLRWTNAAVQQHHPLFTTDDVDNERAYKQQQQKFLWGQAQDDCEVSAAGRKFDRRLTGSSVIDAEINATIDTTFNLFVKPWFGDLFAPYILNNNSPKNWLESDVVIHELRQSINKIFIALANPCKDADFAQYLTTTLVNDFATHVRIFKRAKEFAPFRPPTTPNARDPYSTVLVANFFKAEPRTPPVVCIGTAPEANSTATTTTTTCRENVACNKNTMRDYLLMLSDMLFYLLADRADFDCTLHRQLFNEIFTTTVLLPTMHVLSQPETINRILLWLLQDVECDIDAFLIVIRSPETTRDELLAIREQVEHEMDVHRARDSSTEPSVKEALKAQLQSLEYLQRLIERKIRIMSHAASSAGNSQRETTTSDDDTAAASSAGRRDASYYQRIDRLTPIQHLGLQDVLSNNIALSYFIDFLQTHHESHHMLFFYLTIEGFRLTTNSATADPDDGEKTLQSKNITNKQQLIRDTAISVFDQYLSDKSTHALALYLPNIKRSGEIRRLWSRIVSNEPSPPDTRMFDNLQQKVYNKLNDEYFPAFRASPQYWHMLGDLDLLRGNTTTTRGSSSSVSGKKDAVETKNISENSQTKNAEISLPTTAAAASEDEKWSVAAELTSATIFTDKRRGNTKYAAYRIQVTHGNTKSNGRIWECWRRYSEFRDLHMRIQRRFQNLHGLSFPAKEMNNLRPDVMERRKRALGLYLHTLLYAEVLNSNNGLLDIMLIFLAPGEYNPTLFSNATSPLVSTAVLEKKVSFPQSVEASPVLGPPGSRRRVVNSHLAATNVLADSAQSVRKNVKLLGENVLQMSSNMLSSPLLNIFGGKFLSSSASSSATGSYHIMPFAVSADAASAAEEREVMQNIPLRILLLLMDEVFDLRNRNQWLRNRIIGMLTTLVRATLGDSMNKKIVQFVDYLLSPEQLASYISNFRQMFLISEEEKDVADTTGAEKQNGNAAHNKIDGVSITSNSSSIVEGQKDESSGGGGDVARPAPPGKIRRHQRSVSESSQQNEFIGENKICADNKNEAEKNVFSEKQQQDGDENVFVSTTKTTAHRSRSSFYTLQHQRSSSSSSHQLNHEHFTVQCEKRREKSADSSPVLHAPNSVPSAAAATTTPPVVVNEEEKLRCQIKVLVKAKMLSLMMSQFQSILGTRTVQMGTFTLFDIFQYPVLNTRLLTVLVEGCLQVLFQHNAKQIAQRLQTFHQQSSSSSSSSSSGAAAPQSPPQSVVLTRNVKTTSSI